eukprot:COSAG04_NODE_2426_length_4143_cov_6.064787_4_plen_592_part_00
MRLGLARLAKAMNSVALLLVLLIGGAGVVVSYVVSWARLTPRQRPILLGDRGGAVAVLLVASPCVGTVAFIYSALFFLLTPLFTPAEATILGVRWADGGEALLCALYAGLLCCSAFWLPLTVRAIQARARGDGGGVGAVVLALSGVGLAAALLALAAFMLPAAAAPRAPALVLLRLASAIFALHAILTDLVSWTSLFSSALRRHYSGESLLDGSRSGSDGRRGSVNQIKEAGGSDGAEEAGCCASPRVKALYSNPDWFSVWIGVAYFVAVAIGCAAGLTEESLPYAVRAPWTNNPADSLAAAGVFGIAGFRGAGVLDGILSLLALLATLLLTLAPAAVLCNAGGVKKVLPPFCLIFFIASFARVLGSQETLRRFGLSASLWSLLIGMAIVNILARFEKGRRFVAWLKPASKLGEFYIKVGLVLLCVELKTLGTYGAPAFVVGWGVTPIVLAFMWYIGSSGWLDCCGEMTPTLVMLVASGTSVCGTSAIAACRGSIKAPPDEAVLAISLVSISTLGFMLTLPFFSIAVRLKRVIAGAWIGGAVNNTGNVVASAALLQDRAATPSVRSRPFRLYNAGCCLPQRRLRRWPPSSK